MIGWAIAVLVEIVMLPCESVEVTGTGIATGVVGGFDTGTGIATGVVGGFDTGTGIATGVVGGFDTGTGEGAMALLFDADAGGVETIGSMWLAGCWTAGAL